MFDWLILVNRFISAAFGGMNSVSHATDDAESSQSTAPGGVTPAIAPGEVAQTTVPVFNPVIRGFFFCIFGMFYRFS